MRTLKYFVKQQEKQIEEFLKQNIEKNIPTTLSPTVTIRDLSDLDKESTAIEIKLLAKKKGRIEYKKAENPGYRVLFMKQDTLNGIKIDKEIALPYWASGLIEDHEITPNMIAIGLYAHLLETFDEYYYKVLKSFNLTHLSEEMKEQIDGWGVKSEKN